MHKFTILRRARFVFLAWVLIAPCIGKGICADVLGSTPQKPFSVGLAKSGAPKKVEDATTAERSEASKEDSVALDFIDEPETIYAGQTSTVFYRISNYTNAPISLDGLSINTTAGLKMGPWQRPPYVVDSNSALMVPLKIEYTSTNPALIGKHHIWLLMKFHRLDDKQKIETGIFAEKEVTLAIPGLSDLLKILQIPTFLVLPGILMVITFQEFRGLVRRNGPNQVTKSKPEDLVSPGILIVAVTISGIVVVVYPYLSRIITGETHDILRGFALSDVIAIWVSSILLGMIGTLAWESKIWIDNARKQKLSFSSSDTPMELLKRLIRLKISHILPYKIEGKFVIFKLGNGSAGNTIWVAPAINVRLTEAGLRKVGGDLQTEDTKKLVEKLETLVLSNEATLFWDESPSLSSPQLKPSGDSEKWETPSESILRTK